MTLAHHEWMLAVEAAMVSGLSLPALVALVRRGERTRDPQPRRRDHPRS